MKVRSGLCKLDTGGRSGLQKPGFAPDFISGQDAMPPIEELLLIREEVSKRFQPLNPLTQIIAERLVKTIYQQRRCESLIDLARSVPTRKLNGLPLERQTLFRKKLKKLTETLQELKRSTRVYSASLSAETQAPQDSDAEIKF